ncbi:MAG: FAD-binding oxidoreductase [Woeseiaceae bacterium]|nr:FAD-binding oxidoreductase [Woeseiaceae bacterium]
MIDVGALETRTAELRRQLTGIVPAKCIVDASDDLELLSSDVYSRGLTAALCVRPSRRDTVPDVLGAIAAAGFAIVPRGGGMSYTGGYTPERPDSVIIDLGGLDRIVEINADDMTITVEAGVTWQQIYRALSPRGLRLPFFGTFSGSRATVGGGMSNGALFMGTARFGTAAEIALGFEVATANGRLIRTGQAAFGNGKPFYRTYGPDLTGLFIHDGGALGVKTLISMRLIESPAATDTASYVFTSLERAAAALSAIARSGRAEEAYILDPEATRSSLDSGTLKQDIKRLLNVAKSGGIGKAARLIGAGRNFIDRELTSLHVVCSGNSQAAVENDLQAIGGLVDAHEGGSIANSMPTAARANPFEPLNGILGAQGERWAALNCKVAHSDADTVIAGTQAIFDKHREAMEKHGVWYSRLCIAISNHAFSFEPVLRWHDEWLPLHKAVPEPEHLARFDEPAANPAAREVVDRVRCEIVDLFADIGAASNQIGKTYRYYDAMAPETRELVNDLKRSLDPMGLMNPGVLGLPA